MNSETINTYSRLLPIYEGYNNKLHSLLEELLIDTGIKYHLIESRVKDITSFREKISKPSQVLHGQNLQYPPSLLHQRVQH